MKFLQRVPTHGIKQSIIGEMCAKMVIRTIYDIMNVLSVSRIRYLKVYVQIL